MGIGHFAIGLSLKRADPQMNVAVLLLGTYLLDFLLGLFVLLGLEQVLIPADYSTKHYLRFVFPYSHSLAATSLWAAAVALFAVAVPPHRVKAALILAVAVFSHFFLDVLVHVRGLPVTGPNSPRLGLGLWNHLYLELLLEVGMLMAALGVYLKCTRGKTLLGNYGMVIFMALLCALMVGGQVFASTPPGPEVLAVSWVAQGLLIGAIAFWLDRQRTAA